MTLHLRKRIDEEFLPLLRIEPVGKENEEISIGQPKPLSHLPAEHWLYCNIRERGTEVQTFDPYPVHGEHIYKPCTHLFGCREQEIDFPVDPVVEGIFLGFSGLHLFCIDHPEGGPEGLCKRGVRKVHRRVNMQHLGPRGTDELQYGQRDGHIDIGDMRMEDGHGTIDPPNQTAVFPQSIGYLVTGPGKLLADAFYVEFVAAERAGEA